MSRQITPLAIIVLITIGFAVGTITMVISNSQRSESLHKAYERGKIDGQLLVFKLWGHHDEETIDILIDCIHLTNFSRLGLLYVDSTDTLPAMEK